MPATRLLLLALFAVVLLTRPAVAAQTPPQRDDPSLEDVQCTGILNDGH